MVQLKNVYGPKCLATLGVFMSWAVCSINNPDLIISLLIFTLPVASLARRLLQEQLSLPGMYDSVTVTAESFSRLVMLVFSVQLVCYFTVCLYTCVFLPQEYNSFIIVTASLMCIGVHSIEPSLLIYSSLLDNR